MEEDSLSVDDLFSQCVFHQDEREMVLTAIHRVLPDYQPSLSASITPCSLPLVRDFYTEVPHAVPLLLA